MQNIQVRFVLLFFLTFQTYFSYDPRDYCEYVGGSPEMNVEACLNYLEQNVCDSFSDEDCDYLGNIVHTSSEGESNILTTPEKCQEYCDVFSGSYWIFQVKC